ncbi:T9SS type A sorting domain-containing protein [Adhaeribacter sp. BT258]|uniref:T9SS type A sorting domain-containing protein n=1 Tax=Adhaeribacter terrigena TaxID=2793070 RepID=A0ABS1C4F9_9BACT|nr:T9SS type A sorting domain-containing protein [Adhaeribacter terrigena]MBK0404062.1 T9SS type A sorting domain-containing protein [Adhaeribacter terrigena]
MKKILLSFLAFCTLHFAQAQQTQNVTFSHAGKTIYGTFTMPNGNGPFATIIINPGSGANDRDGTMIMSGATVSCLYPNLLNTTLRIYKDLSDSLVAAGYAVLRYDKIEYTYPTAQTLGPITFKKLWLPVESAIDYVKTRPEVDAKNIILIGHSEGSSLIPYIAKKRRDVKALISIAGARTPFDSLLARQLVHFTQLCNGNVAAAQAQANDVLTYFSIIRSKTWNASTPAFGGVQPAVWSEYIQVTDSVALNYNEANVPTLFTGLQLDLNVPISELSRFQKETYPGPDFYQIPNTIHYMTPNNVPKISEVLTDTIIYWLGKRLMNGVKNDMLEETLVKVYPNPFTDNVTVTLDAKPVKNLNISVQNLLGQTLQEEKFKNVNASFRKTILLQNLPAGIYLLHLQADGKLMTRKIVKEK